jgi:hypothetical protein
MQIHQQGLGMAAQSGNTRALEAMQLHIKQHSTFLQQAQQQQGGGGGQGTPAQETPGLKGYEGNVPNMDHAVESDANIQSRLRGGGA